ncbi:MAG TPA: hypothetical protein VKB84_07425 [Candidatus Binataceae bacterium]|jgi:hypothetical protein|nr:hypothetical protein [Candidatus Binataceae bacterium]
MASPILLQTSRGAYRLSLAEESTSNAGPWTLTLAAEHAGGLEKFAFRCRIAAALVEQSAVADPGAACAKLAGWLQGQFEQVREAALKSIRSEHRLAEIELDEAHPGPFNS